MRAALRPRFLPILDEWEGDVRNMYLDAKGLVTTGHGDLLPLATALDAKWKRRLDGKIASELEVRREWMRIASMQQAKGHGGGNFLPSCTLLITEESLEEIVEDRITSIEAILAQPGHFPTYVSAPSDAQFPLLRLCWAMGPEFTHDDHWPLFHAAYLVGDYLTAADQARMKETGQPREFVRANDAIQEMLRNAAIVVERELDPEPLYWPQCLAITDTDPAPPPSASGASG